MSAALKRIEQTRDALVEALAERNWEEITRLDLTCRECVESVVGEAAADDEGLRNNLEELLSVYRQLIDVATGERQAIVDEMAQIQRAKNATKVYHLFG